MNHTFLQRSALVETAERGLDRYSFIKDVLFAVVCVGLIVLIWSL